MADENNNKIAHLYEFADKFLAKCTLGQMISRYMVLVASEQKLMIMRPYSHFEPQEMMEENKQHFKNILTKFMADYEFNPTLFPEITEETSV